MTSLTANSRMEAPAPAESRGRTQAPVSTTPSGKPEILAPAGSFDAALAAVRCGADAIYLGMGFSARTGAENFDEIAFGQTVEYCHARNVKVYVALNTLLSDTDLKQAADIAETANKHSADALILQDFGLARIIKNCAPDLPLHASTQCSVHSLSGVEFLRQAGFSRVILARELSKQEIAAIASRTNVELETFVHGALCMSVSGQCLMSAFFGGRSGNRGVCAQPCRLPFCAGTCGNALSLKDMSLIEKIPDLCKMGIKSLKIEGRLKRPEYIAAAVSACREMLDTGRLPGKTMERLGAVFSRSGFTSGYYDGVRGADMFGVRTKSDVVAAGNVLKELTALYKDERRCIPADMSLTVKSGRPASLTVSDGVCFVREEGNPPQKARTISDNAARYEEQLRKTGGTPFFARDVKIDADAACFVPVGEINLLRRKALDGLLLQRGERAPVVFARRDAPTEEKIARRGQSEIWARFSSFAQFSSGAQLSILPLDTQVERLASLKDKTRVAVELPRALFGREEYYAAGLRCVKAAGITDVFAGTADGIAVALQCGMDVHGFFGLNITNSGAAREYARLGLKSVLISPELSAVNAGKISCPVSVGVIAYGFLPLMLTRNSPAGLGAGSITDRRGNTMRAVRAGEAFEILNMVTLYMLDKKDPPAVGYRLLYFTAEDKAEAGQLIESAKNGSGEYSGKFARYPASV